MKKTKKTKKSSPRASRRLPTAPSMTFVAHLEELRKRLIWILVAVVAASIGAYVYSDQLILFFSRPIEELVFIKPFEAFLVKIKVALFAGCLLAIPVFLYHTWKYTASGLSGKEKKILLVYFPVSVLLFFIGAFFAQQFIVPLGVRFFLEQAALTATPMISISAYFAFLFWMLLVFGLMFELPLAVFFLAHFGLVTPGALRRQRRYVIVVLFIVAALVTPPDIISQILLAVPLWLLLELSILIAGIVYRKNKPD